MIERLHHSDGLGAIYPPMMYSVMALDVLGYAKEDSVRVDALRQFNNLLVDDGEINRVVGRGLLESLGYEVETVCSGAEALDIVANGRYATILMDCLMPDMDGYEATRRIRALEGPGRHTPIVALTAAAMAGDRERCLAAGMDDYVSKPFDLDLLDAALARSGAGAEKCPLTRENVICQNDIRPEQEATFQM